MIKSIEGARYDALTKAWTIDPNKKDELLKKIAGRCFEIGVKISDTPDFAIQIAK